ncbi:MAG: hypothetical protein RR825_01010 [Ruthenibacterium sp.]
MINPAALFGLKGTAKAFLSAHPKLMPFFCAVRDHAMHTGTVIDIRVTTQSGRTLETNVKLTAQDMKAYREAMAAFGMHVPEE